MFTRSMIKSFFIFFLFMSLNVWADSRCPGADDPAPVIAPPNMPKLVLALEKLKDVEGRGVWVKSDDNLAALKNIFESTPQKTKLEQFYQLLYQLQKQFPEKSFIIHPPLINDVLLEAKVFPNPQFPSHITAVEMVKDTSTGTPRYRVTFDQPEVRFAINQGKGFSTWEQGMCQIAKELVFYPGFSFTVRKARNSKNLVVDEFNKVEIYGQFGTRKVFDIDLSYVDLEKVEFIEGTDQGRVKSRVAKREFQENKHSSLFKFIGTLIPNTSQQRIDW